MERTKYFQVDRKFTRQDMNKRRNRAFLGTNIFVCAYDYRDPLTQSIAFKDARRPSGPDAVRGGNRVR